MALELTSETFESHVLQSDVPVLVDFWGTGCPPCNAIAPLIDDLAEESSGDYRVAKVHVQSAPDLARRFGINAVPTLLFFQKGQVVKTLVGVQSKSALLGAFEEAKSA
ncbi:MAG: thioredoxin [Planctomycetales bacterium]